MKLARPPRELLLLKKSVQVLYDTILSHGVFPFAILWNRPEIGMLLPLSGNHAEPSAIWYSNTQYGVPRSVTVLVPEIVEWVNYQSPQVFLTDETLSPQLTDLLSCFGGSLNVWPLRPTGSSATSPLLFVLLPKDYLVTAEHVSIAHRCISEVQIAIRRNEASLYRKTLVKAVDFQRVIIQAELPSPLTGDAFPPHHSADSDRLHITRRRKLLCLRILRTLTSYFNLSRCEIVYSDNSGTDLWSSIPYGFPKQIRQRTHTRLLGLTGKTLSCSNPDEVIVSSSVEADPRWSRLNGDTFFRNRFEPPGCPIAMAGIPLFSRVDENDTKPYGAIIAIRPHEYSYGTNGPFTKIELRMLRLAALAVAHGLDTLRWRDLLLDATSWQLAVDRLWGSESAPDITFRQLLEIFYESIQPCKLLIAVCDSDRQQISGRAVFGGYLQTLVHDTARTLFHAAPSIPSAEDVLSKVCREGIVNPFLIHPNDSTDPFYVHLHQQTRRKHHVEQTIVVIPIPDRTGRIQAVIIGELPHRTNALPIRKLRQMKEFARHVSALIEFMGSDDEQRRRKRIISLMESLSSSLFRDSRSRDVPDSVSLLRQMVDAICDEFSFGKCVVYRHDHQTARLVGLFGLGVNGNEVRQTAYSVKAFERPTERRTSVAVHVFHTMRCLFLPAMSHPPVDQDDCARVGIPDDYCGFALPLSHNHRVEGIAVFCWKPRVSPPAGLTPTCEETLRTLGSFLGLVLAAQKVAHAADVTQRESNSKDLFLSHVVRFGAAIQADITSRGVATLSAEVLETIAREVAERFGCFNVGLFLSDNPSGVVQHPASVPGCVVTSAPPLSPQQVYGRSCGIKYYLRAAYGYLEGIVFKGVSCYTAFEDNHISHVLRTASPMSWTSSPVCAGQSHTTRSGQFPLDKEAQYLGDLPPVYTWMCVPLVFCGVDENHLYGAMSCARAVTNGGAAAFSHDDLALAQTISAMLSFAFHVKDLMRDERDSMARLLHLIRHDDVHSAIGDIAVYADEIMRQAQLLDDTLETTRIFSDAQSARNAVSIVTHVIDAYASYAHLIANNTATWNFDDCTVSECIQDVIAHWSPTATHENIGIRVATTSSRSISERCGVDRSKTTYIACALIGNAIKSIRCAARKAGDIVVSVDVAESEFVVLAVRDNGIGVDGCCEESCLQMFKKGVSGFNSSGLGLWIVKCLLESYSGCVGRMIGVRGEVGVFAEISVRIPIVRKGE